mmetsp:Transcript_37897/g.52563  ORF Transcript_37897/g.52563 Transcript_37897/m.52563 type:complete len:199 (+) Transcript_37897:149-745(+)
MARLGRVGPGMVQHPEEDWKVLALGDEGAGKSSFVIQFVDSVFTDEYDPTIEDNFRKNVPVDGVVCALDILDTARQESYSALRDQFLRSAEGFLILYSITSRSSLAEVMYFFEILMRIRDLDYVPWVLIGNKCDLVDERKITTEEGKQLAKKYHAPFFETSAKDRTNVYEAVEALVRKIREDNPDVRRHKSRNACILL